MIPPCCSIRTVLLALVIATSLAGCPGEFSSCQGPVVSHPDGRCSAYYYQSAFGNGEQMTQAVVSCNVKASNLGGGVVAFPGKAHGIGLRWIDGHTLEVAVPDGVRLEQKNIGGTYYGYVLRYVYRSLQSSESEYEGCGI